MPADSCELSIDGAGLAVDKKPPEGLPSWYPAWARELAELYFSGTTCLFVLHGNVHDLVDCGDAGCGKGEDASFCNIEEFLAGQVFGSWDYVLSYDLGHGLRPVTAGDADRFKQMARHLAPWGEPASWPREPEKVLAMLDRLVDRALLSTSPTAGKSVGVMLPYAQYLVPAGDVGALSGEGASRLVRLLGWAQNPYIKRINIAFCLITEKLSEINDRLIQNPHVATIEIPLPDTQARRRFAESIEKDTADGGEPGEANLAFDASQIADISAGLSLVNLNVLLSQAKAAGQRVDAGRFRGLKKSIIERQCGNLLEFIEPEHTLELVVGHDTGKQRLEKDADWITRGRLEVAPMGYLLCGPVGTGKSFLAECYAGTIGIPCVKLKNFRSKYVGETEGNLQRVFTVLRSLGPVVVIIDEADAALGSRRSEGDSGTSARVFSMIAAQMGDARYRGKIIWMLLTCRPDLLPIDLKRQGRAEVHIPLFYPDSDEELSRMLAAMARKNKVAMATEKVPTFGSDRQLSGADVESIVLSAHRYALSAGRAEVGDADLQTAVDRFIPSAQGLEKELQEIVAVLECTDGEFLPEQWRDKIQEPGGRAALQQRMVAIRQLMEE